MKKRACMLILTLLLCLTSAALAEPNHQLRYNGYSVNDVTIVWNDAERVLSVSYTDSADWFSLNDMNEAQNTVLQKRNASGTYEALPGVTSRIVSAYDERSDGAYGTVALRFFAGDAPYAFEPGAEYAVSLDIVANGYRHASVKGELFEFTTASASPTGADSDIVGAWLSEPYFDGTHAYLELRADGSCRMMLVAHDSQYTGSPENWGDGNWVTDSTEQGTYTYTGDQLSMRTDDGGESVTSYRMDGERLCLTDETGVEIVFNLIERYGGTQPQSFATSAYDAYPILWTNNNTEAVYATIPEYDALFRFDEPTTVTCLTTYHWNDGLGDNPGSIGIYAYDTATEESTEVGIWTAVGRSGYGGAQNVYWDIFPNVTLEAGRSYFVNTNNDDTWSWNEASDGCGIFEVRGYAGNAQPPSAAPASTMPPSPFATDAPSSTIPISPFATDAPTESFDMIGTWAIQIGRGYAGTVEITWQQGGSFTGTIRMEDSSESLPDGIIVGDAVSFTRTWSDGMTQTYTGTLTTANGAATVSGTFEGAGGGDDWQMTRISTALGDPGALAEQIVGAWLSVIDSEGQQGYMEFLADGTFSLSMVSHDPQSEGTTENWGDGKWAISEAMRGAYTIQDHELALLVGEDAGVTLSISIEGDRLYTVDEYDEEIVFISLGGAQSPASAPSGGSPFAAAKQTEPVLWTNGNSDAVQNDARKYYVMFELPDCTVVELETYHYQSGGKAPGAITLYAEDGSTYGPFQAEGREGQGGVQNAYWVAKVDLELPAGRYAIEDSDPETWSNNAASDGWGMATVRGTAKERTGNPFLRSE